MKIRDRLTYTLSLTGFIAITILGILIYFFTSNFYQQQFFVMLEERVALSELMFLENEETKKAIRDRFLQRLEEEEEYAISLKPSGIDSIKTLFSESLYEKILSDGKIRFKNDRRYGAGKKYELQRGDYVVIVTATDQIGESHLRFLKRVLITGGILLILALIVVYRVGIARALRPLENKIYRASRIRADNLETRMEIENPDDEVGRVAIAFNLMLDRIQQAFEAQKHFVRNASHEMRNPLTAITGEIEVLLARERSSDEYKGTLRVIQKEADRLQHLIRDLLALEKAEAMYELPDPENIELGELILESIEQFPSHRISLDFNPESDDIFVKGNPTLLRTAVTNLIDNGLKYSGDKPVLIKFEQVGENAWIKIKDQGIGISKEDLKQIFQPFFRAQNARGEQGYGIGLALVNKIIGLHHGQIHIHSKPEEGTTVSFSIPVK